MTNQLTTTGDRFRQIENLKQQYIPLLREMIVGGRKLTDEQIVGRALFAAAQDLDPLSEVHTITDRDGRTMAHTMSINGLRRKNAEQVGNGNEIIVQFVSLPKEQLPAGAAYGYECYLRDGQSYSLWQKRLLEVGKAVREALGQPITFQELLQVVGPSPVTTGVGIVYAREANEYKDQNFNPIERCKKRAELNARHHRFSTNAPIYEGADDSAPLIVESVLYDAPPIPQSPNSDSQPVPRPESEILSDLGFEPEPPHTAPTLEQPPALDEPDIPLPPAAPPTATASDGTLYADLPTDQLAFRANALAKFLRGGSDLSPEKRAEKQAKLTEIQRVLKARNQ